jgi:LacI family transcriptional regulator
MPLDAADDVDESRPDDAHGRRVRVTAVDVAALAGTSVATVSLVANGKTKGRVSPETATRVVAAIDTLGYVVDHAASALARGTADVVILVAPDLSNPYYGDVVRGITSVLGDRYQLLLSVTSTGVQPDASAVRRFASLRPAGLLVDAPSASFLADLPAGPAMVLLDAPGLEHREATVNYDLRPGIDDLVDHLADQGHRVVAYLDSITGTDTFTLRRSLVHEAAAERGLVMLFGAASIIDVAAATEAADAAWETWQEAGVTAVVCATDTHAYGALLSARNRGVRVPEDLAVAGFDDLPSSAVTAPGLTSVALPGLSMGRTAARRLLDIIGDDSLDDGLGMDPELAALLGDDLTARLIVRDSTVHEVRSEH